MVRLRPGTIWPTDEEDAAITAGAESDPDNPIWPDEMIRNARPMAEVHPELVAEWVREREEIEAAERNPMKFMVTLILDLDIAEAFQAAGPDWKEQMKDALRARADALKEKLGV
jgi:uncharacterized protein (DUF4415 family)